MGKSSINGSFSMATLNNQMVILFFWVQGLRPFLGQQNSLGILCRVPAQLGMPGCNCKMSGYLQETKARQRCHLSSNYRCIMDVSLFEGDSRYVMTARASFGSPVCDIFLQAGVCFPRMSPFWWGFKPAMKITEKKQCFLRSSPIAWVRWMEEIRITS